MTSTDRLSIVETQEATQKLPLFVMPNLEAANDPLSTPIAPRENRIKSISFDVYDYEQKSSPGLDGIPKPPVKTKTMAVEEVERLSPTHMIFKGKDGESVEIKDGKACATKQKAELERQFSIARHLLAPSWPPSKTGRRQLAARSRRRV